MFYDLHRHLEGSHSAHALLSVAREFHIHHPHFFDARRGEFRSEAELTAAMVMSGPVPNAQNVFYELISKGRAAYVSVEAIELLARHAFTEAAEDTDGFEMRLSLFSMTRALLTNTGELAEKSPNEFGEKAREILLAVERARAAAQHASGKPMLLRVGWTRTYDERKDDANFTAVARVVKEHAKLLVGQDILGIPPAAPFEPLPAGLLRIIENLRSDLPDLTVHAGELESHASVDETLKLNPRGIGHGVRSLESNATLERLAKEGVTLEVCPTSNALLIAPALRKLGATMPLKSLQHAHVHCVLGSDDPSPMGTSFRQELRVAREGGVDMARLEADIARRWSELFRSSTT